MSGGPVVSPNDVAIELFREMGHTLRRLDDKQDAMGEKLDLARQELAEVRGAEIPEALRALQTNGADFEKRIRALEEAERTRAAVVKPWLATARELLKPLAPLIVGAVLAYLGIKGLKP